MQGDYVESSLPIGRQCPLAIGVVLNEDNVSRGWDECAAMTHGVSDEHNVSFNVNYEQAIVHTIEIQDNVNYEQAIVHTIEIQDNVNNEQELSIVRNPNSLNSKFLIHFWGLVLR